MTQEQAGTSAAVHRCPTCSVQLCGLAEALVVWYAAMFVCLGVVIGVLIA